MPMKGLRSPLAALPLTHKYRSCQVIDDYPCSSTRMYTQKMAKHDGHLSHSFVKPLSDAIFVDRTLIRSTCFYQGIDAP